MSGKKIVTTLDLDPGGYNSLKVYQHMDGSFCFALDLDDYHNFELPGGGVVGTDCLVSFINSLLRSLNTGVKLTPTTTWEITKI